MTAWWLSSCLPPPGSPRRRGRGTGCTQGQETCPEVRTRLGAPATPPVAFGCPAPAGCQPCPSTHFAARHHTPARLQSHSPRGDEPACPPRPPVLASVLWVTLRWLWVPGAHAHRPRCRGHAPCLGALCHQPQLISRDEAGEEMRLSCPSLLFSPGLDLSGMGA